MEINTLITDNIKMDYIKIPGGSRVLVILPGIGLQSINRSAGAISSAYRCFRDEYTLYVLDRKSNLHADCSIEEFADDTDEAMEALGIESADVFGASMGGMIAQELALRHPGRVRSLILGSTVSRPNPTANGVLGEWVQSAEEGNVRALCESFLNKLYSPALAAQLAQISEMIFGEITAEDLRRFVIQARSIIGFDCYDRLDKIKCPVFVIGVENDGVVTAEASREIAERLGCELYIYGSEYGHCVFDEAPDYKERMMHWLGQAVTSSD